MLCIQKLILNPSHLDFPLCDLLEALVLHFTLSSGTCGDFCGRWKVPGSSQGQGRNGGSGCPRSIFWEECFSRKGLCFSVEDDRLLCVGLWGSRLLLGLPAFLLQRAHGLLAAASRQLLPRGDASLPAVLLEHGVARLSSVGWHLNSNQFVNIYKITCWELDWDCTDYIDQIDKNQHLNIDSSDLRT